MSNPLKADIDKGWIYRVDSDNTGKNGEGLVITYDANNPIQVRAYGSGGPSISDFIEYLIKNPPTQGDIASIHANIFTIAKALRKVDQKAGLEIKSGDSTPADIQKLIEARMNDSALSPAERAGYAWTLKSLPAVYREILGHDYWNANETTKLYARAGEALDKAKKAIVTTPTAEQTITTPASQTATTPVQQTATVAKTGDKKPKAAAAKKDENAPVGEPAGEITQEQYDAAQKTFGAAGVLQSVLTLSGKAYDPRWDDDKHQERTNAALTLFLNEQSDKLKIPVDLKSKFPANNNKGLMDKPVDPTDLKALNDFLLLNSINTNLRYRMDVRQNAIDILDKERNIGSAKNAHDVDDLKSVRVFTELFGMHGDVLKNSADILAKLKKQQADDQVKWDVDPSNPDVALKAAQETASKADDLKVKYDADEKALADLKEQLAKEKAAREAAEKKAADEAATIDGLKQEIAADNQKIHNLEVDCYERDTWMNSLHSSGLFPEDDKAAKLGKKYCDMINDSGWSLAEMRRGMLHVESDGHLILVRASEQRTFNGQPVVLAYDITKHIDDERKLAGIDTVRLSPPSMREMAAVVNASREHAKSSGQPFIDLAGAVKKEKADVKHGFDKEYSLHGRIVNGQFVANVVPNHVWSGSNQANYVRAWEQTPDFIREKSTAIDNLDNPDKLDGKKSKADGHRYRYTEIHDLAKPFEKAASGDDKGALDIRHAIPGPGIAAKPPVTAK